MYSEEDQRFRSSLASDGIEDPEAILYEETLMSCSINDLFSMKTT